MIKIDLIPNSNQKFVKLVLEMRMIMDSLNKTDIKFPHDDAELEAKSCFSENRQVFGIYYDEELVGYSVLKTEDCVCWLDWIYVKPEFRGTNAASKLFDYSEKVAKEIGSDQLYIWVHPDNRPMLKFLKKKGYDVLNLIEVKKIKKNINSVVMILDNQFRY
jgi:GNAT superfamily N-acetyltransferase